MSIMTIITVTIIANNFTIICSPCSVPYRGYSFFNAEAIELYKDFLIEQIRNNNLNAEIVDDEIVVTDDEENEVERFINFEIED